MKDNFLKIFGFSDREFLVYTTLVTRGALTMSEIVTASGLHRPYAYKTVEMLLTKELVSITQSEKKKIYLALAPTKVKQLLEDTQEKVADKLDELEEIYTSPHLETSVTHFQGKKGITAIFRDLVVSQKKSDVFYRYTSEKDTEYANTFLPKDYRALRDKKGLERFVIASGAVASTKQKRLERAMKIIPKNESHFNQDCIQLIYGDKVAFINLAKIQGIIIEDKNLASFQKEIFTILYKRL